MSEQSEHSGSGEQDGLSTERGWAEEHSGAPATPAEDNPPASASSHPGGSSRARGAAEEATDSPRTE